MRRLRILILLAVLAACFSSCRRAAPSLSRISSFIRTEPERALTALEDYRDSLPSGRFNRAYYALLYSEALDRCYIDVASDTIILPAVEFFDKKGPDSLKVKAWYYIGLVQKNAKNYASAIFSLLKAAQAATDNKNYHYRGLAHRAISQIYGESFSDINDANYMIKAIEDFDLAGSEYYADYSRLLLAGTYIDLGHYSLCDSLLSRLIEDYEVDSTLLASVYRFKTTSMVLSNNYNPSEVIHFYNKAKSYYKTAYDRPQLAIMAIPFEMLNQKQAADSCITKAYDFSYTIADTALVDYEKHLLLKKRGLYKDANVYLEKAVHVQDSLVNALLDNSVDYAVSELNKHEYALEKAKREKQQIFMILIILITILVLLLLTAIVVVLIRRVRERNERINKYKKQAEAAKDKIETLTQRILQYESDLQNLQENLQRSLDKNKVVTDGIIEQIRERVRIIQKIMQQYDILCIKENNNLSFMDKYEALETIVDEHHDMIGDLRLDSMFIDGLEEAVNACMDNVMLSVRSYFGKKIKEEDYRILVCTLAGLQPKATSFVTGISSGTVRTKKSRWLDKIENITDPEIREILYTYLAEVSTKEARNDKK